MKFRLISNIFFNSKVGKWVVRLLREVVDPSSLEVFKTWLDEALGNLGNITLIFSLIPFRSVDCETEEGLVKHFGLKAAHKSTHHA